MKRKGGCSTLRVQTSQTSSQTKSGIISGKSMSKTRKRLSPKVPTGLYLSLTTINSLKSISESDTEVREILCVTSLALISIKGVRPVQSAPFLGSRGR